MSNYPSKCWYTAAMSDEISTTPVSRRLLGQDVVLWRGGDGCVNAFENRCAHRGFPLSHGFVENGQLVCGYHGCTYSSTGECVHIPSQPHVPTGMRVPVYPIIEDPPFIWIWLGPPTGAATGRPPTVPWVNDPQWDTFTSFWPVGANYLMVHEHYLDLSYAHAGDSTDGISRPTVNDVETTETTVSYTRTLPDAPLADWEADAMGLDRHTAARRREFGTFASPALHLRRWDVHAPSGEIYSTSRVHAITPETDTSTHVFLAVARNYAPGQESVTNRLKSSMDDVVRQDISILEMASDHSGYDRWRTGSEFQADEAVVRVRRIVSVMLTNEATADRSASVLNGEPSRPDLPLGAP
ncbi:aromatic ring-hydroxylating dioxygenase subunit alpha [Mycolicibacterium septicum]|uniref:aromatic ring-hydroxylating dioxygenase subunit alpha n=1 Tax=Mycolicibacterium septicum TaxID=98668 RepID=UPI00235DDE57|nr:aromatic ring-hydroxylating dioxygenase subunit alpha [Mycolicibacterium septicum]